MRHLRVMHPRAMGASKDSPNATREDGALETVVIQDSARTPVRTESAITSIGTSIGRYVVLEEVGAGGMGRVLRAYDPKLQREVALKEVRNARLGEEGTKRLVAEARAMAKVSHPNVVAVYDVEQPLRDRVVLVMQYVAGQTLRTWLKKGPRPWREVVQAFRAAGRGLAAAHAAGVLHRDFKPANVLMGVDGSVKVTDFGLAKAVGDTGSSGEDKGASISFDEGLTMDGVVMGTPRYMAPEQHRALPLTEAADQYAYCVALWEALCGEPPFSSRSMSSDKHRGPPAWPAKTVPRRIGEAVRRGLAPRPDDRWPNMDALITALAHDPATRRRRWWMGLGGLGVLAAAVGGWQAQSATGAQPCTGATRQLAGVWDDTQRARVRDAILGVGTSYAPAVWAQTERSLDDHADQWAAMHTETCEATTLRGEQSSEVMDLRMACLHRAKVDLAATVQLLAEADAAVVQKAHDVVGGLRPLARCADVDALRAEVDPPSQKDAAAVEQIRARLAEVGATVRAGRYAAAQQKLDEARPLLETVQYVPVRTEVKLAEGKVLETLGRYEASEIAYREALLLAAQGNQREAMQRAAATLIYVVGYRQRRADEGLRYRELAVGLVGDDPEQRAQVHDHIATVLLDQGKLDEALHEHERSLELRESALGSADHKTATSRNNLALVLQQQGKYEEAERELRAALEVYETTLGPEHPFGGLARCNVANVLGTQSRHAEAIDEYRPAIEVLERALGASHPNVAQARHNLATALYSQGEYEEAEDLHRRALADWEKALGSEHPHIASARMNLALVVQARGRHEEAEAEFLAALTPFEAALGPAHPDVAAVRINLATLYIAAGKHEEAEPVLRGAIETREQALGSEHPELADTRTSLAGVLLELGRPREALPLARTAWARAQAEDFPEAKRPRIAATLARILVKVERDAAARQRARTLAEDALRGFEQAGATQDAQALRRWLDTLE
jgi:eukaryotic-like serine/threonine-protein kinase